MSTYQIEVLSNISRSTVNVYSYWNNLPEPNRRCYWKAYTTSGGDLSFTNPLQGYTNCDLVITTTINSTTYNGFSGSKTGVSVEKAGVIYSTNSKTLTGVIPSSSLYCKLWQSSSFEITNLNVEENTYLEGMTLTVQAKYVYTFEHADPTITNLTVSNNFWEKDINVNWRSTAQSGYEYEYYYNNLKIGSGTGGTVTSFTIPANTFKGTLPASIKIRTFNTRSDGVKIYSAWSEQAITLKNIDATISNLIVTGSEWEKDIVLSWQSADQQQFTVEAWKDNAKVKSWTGTTATQLTIPASILSKGQYTFIVKVAYANRYVNSASKTVTLEDIVATISNLTIEGDMWEYPIKLFWQSINQQQFKIEVLKSNQVVKTYTGTTAKEYTIPANDLSVGQHTIRVTVAYANRYVNSSEKVVTLKDIVAEISDLIVAGKYWEEAIEVSWQSKLQQQHKIEVWQNNELKNTYTGTTATRCTIPKNTLKAGTYLIKVWVAYANRFVNNLSSNIILEDILPSVDNVALSGSNVDYNLTLSWDSTYQNKATIEIHSNEGLVDTIDLTTEKKYVITNNTLKAAFYTFKVKVAYTSATGDRWTDFKQLNVTLVESLPSIGALQPDGVIVDKNEPVNAWWTSQNQTKYTLEVVGSAYTYTGTTEKQHIIPVGTLQVGTYTLKLTVTYVTGASVQKSVVKESKFIVTGKPNTPTLKIAETFDYSRPIIEWDSVEQLGFICTVEDLEGNELWTSGEQNGLITRVQCMNYLANGTYKAKVMIMNEFSIKSDWAAQQFEVLTNETVNINLNIEDIDFGKMLKWTNENAYYDAFYIIRDDKVIAKTNKVDYLDYTCKHGSNVYLVRGVTSKDTYKDSNIIYANLQLPHNTLATVSATNDIIDCELQRNDYEGNVSHSINNTVIYLNGREQPIVIYGEHTTEQHTISFVATDHKKFISMCDKREPFVYKDRLGNVVHLSISNPQLTIDRTGYRYSATGLKVDYNEVVDYD